MSDELIALLKGRRGHFQMESGYHSELWFNLDSLFEEEAKLRPHVQQLAQQLSAFSFDVVCGPMTGGATLAKMIGLALGRESVYTERIEPSDATGLFPIKYRIPETQRSALRGKTVAIVDDAISAGSAVRGTYADLIECGAIPVACGALIIFGKAPDKFSADNNLHLVCTTRMSFGLWKPEDCPLCRTGISVEKISAAPSPRKT